MNMDNQYGSPQKTGLSGVLDAAVEIIPFVTSSRLLKEEKYGAAAFWAAIDAAALATLVVPVVGECVQGGVASAKVAGAVRVARNFTQAAKVLERVPQGVKIAEESLKIGKTVYPILSKLLPVAERIGAVEAVQAAKLARNTRVMNRVEQYGRSVMDDLVDLPKQPRNRYGASHTYHASPV